MQMCGAWNRSLLKLMPLVAAVGRDGSCHFKTTTSAPIVQRMLWLFLLPVGLSGCAYVQTVAAANQIHTFRFAVGAGTHCTNPVGVAHNCDVGCPGRSQGHCRDRP
jgi:hypothetical protein